MENLTSNGLKDAIEFICLSQDDFEKLQSVGDVIVTKTEAELANETQKYTFQDNKTVVSKHPSDIIAVTDEVSHPVVGNISSLPVEERSHELGTTQNSNTENDSEEGKSVVIDTSNPIYLSNNSIIAVENKKCVLHYSEDLQKMIAYPIIIPTKPRGRPKKFQVTTEENEKNLLNDKNDNQSESNETIDNLKYVGEVDSGMIATVTDDGQFVMRSSRKRKQATTLKEYETRKLKEVFSDFEESDEESGLLDGNRSDTEQHKPKRKLKKSPLKNDSKTLDWKQLNLPFLQQEKRSRGRPRRNGVKHTQGKVFRIHGNGQNLTIKIPDSNIPKDMTSEDVANSLSMCLQKNPKETVAALAPSIVTVNQMSSILRPIQPAPPKIPEENSCSKDLRSDTCYSEDQLKDDIANLQVNQLHNLCSQYLNFSPRVGNTVESINQEIADSDSFSPRASKDSYKSPSYVEDSTFSTSKHINCTMGRQDRKENDVAAIEESNSVNLEVTDKTVVSISQRLISENKEIKLGDRTTSEKLKRIVCSKCDYQATCTQAYEDHLLSSHSVDLLSCNACDQFALETRHLVNHYQENHPKLLCWLCDHMAESIASARKHMLTVHEMESPTCKICHKVYKNHNILKMHMKLVHYPTSILYECQICSKKFNRKAHLKRHLRTHDPQRLHQCPMCEYKGVEKSDLTKHMVVHDEPKHVCQTCDHSFRHQRNLDLHIKRHLGQKDYKCGICSYYGYTFTDIRKHIERRHKGINSYLCENCREFFMSEENFKEHCNSNSCMPYAIQLQVTEGGTTSSPDNSTISGVIFNSESEAQNDVVEEPPGSYEIVITADECTENADVIDAAAQNSTE